MFSEFVGAIRNAYAIGAEAH